MKNLNFKTFIFFNLVNFILCESAALNQTSETLSNTLRPGQYVSSYNISVTTKRNGFDGRAILRVVIYNSQTRGLPVKLRFQDLTLHSVRVGIVNLNNPQLLQNVTVRDDVLYMTPPVASSTYMFDIIYSGDFRNDFVGLYEGQYNNRQTYVAMNLSPIHARKVFPCMDNPTDASEISVHFKCEVHRNVAGNSVNIGPTNQVSFASIRAPPHLWGLVAHNFISTNVINTKFVIHSRVENQDIYAQNLANRIFDLLSNWTEVPYFEIQRGQEENIHLFALPDMTKEWNALSTIPIWEPYILSTDNLSMRQRVHIFNAIAEGLARQWFGYVIYPQNWRYAWITKGLAMTAAYEIASEADIDLNMEEYFLTEVIHESMYQDSFSNSEALEPETQIFEEEKIMRYLNGIMQYKAAAVLRTLKLVVDKNDEMIKYIGQALLSHRSMNHINRLHFYDAINSKWFFIEDRLINDIVSFLEPYIHKPGYAILNVNLRPGGVILTQSLFRFTNQTNDDDDDYEGCNDEKENTSNEVIFKLPITYTTGREANFSNIYPQTLMMKNNSIYQVDLTNNDWIVFNIKGQGYYRVNYDSTLWERLIGVLNSDSRSNIHRLNRASILGDILNLARAGKQSYDTAMKVVISMENESDYAPWRAFVRNMNFIRKHLLAYEVEDEFNVSDVYTQLLRLALTSFENEIGFVPNDLDLENLSTSKTRGLVMDHACRAGYQPCLVAAHKFFYADTNETDINPEISSDLRPAVFCAMVQEDGEKVVDLLWGLYNEEVSHYERVVILESFACSRNNQFITSLLEETLNETGRFGTKERLLFFEAVVESNLENTIIALTFLSRNTNLIKFKYGGPDMLNRIIYKLTDNLVTEYHYKTFETWVEAVNTDLGGSEETARLVLSRAKENLIWRETYLEEIYTWIHDNIQTEESTTEVTTTTEDTTTTEEPTTITTEVTSTTTEDTTTTTEDTTTTTEDTTTTTGDTTTTTKDTTTTTDDTTTITEDTTTTTKDTTTTTDDTTTTSEVTTTTTEDTTTTAEVTTTTTEDTNTTEDPPTTTTYNPANPIAQDY